MIVVLNGPLGVGKSTLAGLLTESIEGCVMLDGDHLVAANPPPSNEVEHLHSTLELLVRHHRGFGYAHMVINHLWTEASEVEDLRGRLGSLDPDIRVFRLVLERTDNLRRIERRADARATDERDFELRTFAREYDVLSRDTDGALGEPFDVSDRPEVLVERMLRKLGH